MKKLQDLGGRRFAWFAAALILSGCGVFEYWGDSGRSRVIGARPIPAFTVPPKEDGKAYLQFIAVGDFGTGRHGQVKVAQAMAQKVSADPVEFVLVLGDNFYQAGVKSIEDEQWKTKFVDMYADEALQVPFHAVLGNHDHRGNVDAQVQYSKIDTRWSMPARYYTFVETLEDSTRVQFFGLDTKPLAGGEDDAEEQLQWLTTELAASTADWRVVYGHHTIHSNGSHGPTANLVRRLEPLLTGYGVDLYLCGHDHDQQLLQPRSGVHYVVSGAGSKSRSVWWEEDTIYAGTNFGFTWFRISASEMLVEFLDGDAILRFAYVIPAKVRTAD